MAASDARTFPKKNAAYRVYFPIMDADGDLVTGATGLDSEVSIDGGTFADCTNEATEIATNSGMYYLDLTSGEMNGDAIALIIKTTSVGAKTTPIVLYTAAEVQVADQMLDRDMSVGTDSGNNSTIRTPREAFRAIRNRVAIASGTMTVYKENDSTTSWTSALTGTAGADPITESNPAG